MDVRVAWLTQWGSLSIAQLYHYSQSRRPKTGTLAEQRLSDCGDMVGPFGPL